MTDPNQESMSVLQGGDGELCTKMFVFVVDGTVRAEPAAKCALQ